MLRKRAGMYYQVLKTGGDAESFLHLIIQDCESFERLQNL